MALGTDLNQVFHLLRQRREEETRSSVPWSQMPNDSPGRSLGLFLDRLRRQTGWTLEELAATTGVSDVQLGKIERGEVRRPHADTWQRIARSLRVQVRDLQEVCWYLYHLEHMEQEVLSILFEGESAEKVLRPLTLALRLVSELSRRDWPG
jgi:transcriptional regulator with XRE-family HTH domain